MRHIFRQESKEHVLYTLNKNKVERKVMPDVNKFVFGDEEYKYQWKGVPQSVFFKQNNCYYIFGEGAKTSRQIIKWDHSRYIGNSLVVVRPMETERRFFSVCQLGGEIYIVGGENDRDGCLTRC